MAGDTDNANQEPSRRGFLKSIAIVGGGAAGGVLLGTKVLAGPAPASATPRPTKPEEAIKALVDGNARWVAGSPIHPNLDATVRAAQAEKQTPWAAVLSCADSRVGPELIFDQGIGDLFVVRVAGNIASPDAVASLAYAVEHLGVRAIVVLGHESCGAVKATVETIEKGGDGGEFAVLINAIRPAVPHANGEPAETIVNKAIEANVRLVTTSLPEASAILAKEHFADELVIQPAYYSVKSGAVTML